MATNRGQAYCNEIQAQTISCSGNASIGGGLTVTGDLDGTGLIRKGLPASTKPDSNQTIDRNSYTICAPVGTGNYAWTIFGIGQQNGDWVKVHCNSVGNCTLKDPLGNTLIILSGGLSLQSATAILVDGTWIIGYF
jgi:hypothetical protein